MSLLSYQSWNLELGAEQTTVTSLDELRSRVSDAASLESGRLFLCADAGPRPFWQRIFGVSRYSDFLFAIEWFDDYASLIFLDPNASEYRALDTGQPVRPPEDIRRRIAHGEVQPPPAEECMLKVRAFRALEDFLRTGERPEWLSYRLVE